METGMLWALGITLFGTAGFFVLIAIRYFARYQRSRHQVLPTIAPEYPRYDNQGYDNQRYDDRYSQYDNRYDRPAGDAAVWQTPAPGPAPVRPVPVDPPVEHLPTARIETRTVGAAHQLESVDDGTAVTLEPGRTYSVGRSRECDLHLRETTVSRRHAHLTVTPDGAVVLEDLGSSNGTTVNDRPVTAPVRLGQGDMVRFGRVSGPVFRYLHVAHTEVVR
jgi:FHA domain